MKTRLLIFFCFALAVTMSQAADAPDLNASLREAAMKGDLDAVKSLLSRGAVVDATTEFGATALIFAADRGHLEVVKALIDKGADVNKKDTSYQSAPIVWAAYNGHAEVVSLLLSKGAEGASDMLDMAIEREHKDVAKAVLASGKVSKESMSLTLAAARQQGADEVAQMLVDAGAVPLPKASSVLSAEQLAERAGDYHNEGGKDITVAVDDGRLMVRRAGADTMELSPKGDGRFILVGAGPVTVSFNMDGKQVTGLTVIPPEPGTVYKKMPKTAEEPQKEKKP